MGYELEDLKKDYSELEKKYKLPSFDEINDNFEIEKMDRKSDVLLKIIRKVMMDKVINIMNFLEMFLNPMNAPRMYHGYLKAMAESDKKVVEGIYGQLADLIFISLERDIKYDVAKEAEVVKKIIDVWSKVSVDLDGLIIKMKNPGESVKKEKSYFG